MKQDWIAGKGAIVTGGASGIGRGIALEAGKTGAKVIVADLNAEMGQETVEMIEAEGGQALFIPTDVTDSRSLATFATQAAAYAPVCYLANSVGLQTYGTVDTTSEADWDRTIAVNLKGMFLATKAILPLIRANGGGGVVHISSIQGKRCQKNVLAYSTSKGAVIAMTRSMGIDHAAEGIYINCICPGSIDTPMLRYGAGEHGPADEVIAEWGRNHPIGRVGQPEEVAKTTLFLWSPDSNFIVGQALNIDGGLGSIIF
ncbi:SDR family NAD(P)-dependent oxidoreductase [Phaeodactylibacter xiamenensis]|uniref:SDR family NAD(P)-dependent oxidoreductase n=1 Tax=Phaeodactylibacter xiamenensis TaxID=1524460 RepID=UPI0024A80FC9|nr:SDR family NAD(P)-dependent oxidoreductase [Phaeodactylibacter xiamenensis]